MSRFVIIDVSNIAWRAFHTTGHLESADGIPSGTLYGLMREIKTLRNTFPDYTMVFTFDVGQSLREKIYPQYKETRRKKRLTDGDEHVVRSVKDQIDSFRKTYLPRLGFSNILFQSGYEADDIIASVCKWSVKKNEAVIIVSGDKDLYQVLAKNIAIWNPLSKSMFTKQMFSMKFFKLKPHQWADVKALAGCVSDDISGIPGIGEVFAASYITGTLAKDSKAYSRIITEPKSTYICNLRLTKLPYPGIDKFDLQDDQFSEKTWNEVV